MYMYIHTTERVLSNKTSLVPQQEIGARRALPANVCLCACLLTLTLSPPRLAEPRPRSVGIVVSDERMHTTADSTAKPANTYNPESGDQEIAKTQPTHIDSFAQGTPRSCKPVRERSASELTIVRTSTCMTSCMSSSYATRS